MYGSVITTRPMDGRYCKIYRVMVNTMPMVVRYCNMYRVLVNTSPMDGKYCKIYVVMVNTLPMVIRYCNIYGVLVNTRPMDRKYCQLPPYSICSNGDKIFIVYNFQKRILEFSRKGNEAWKTENTTGVLSLTECMINFTNSQFPNKLNN